MEQLKLMKKLLATKRPHLNVCLVNESANRSPLSLCFVGGRPDSLTDGNREEEKGEISSLKQKHHELAGQHLTSFFSGDM